MDGAPNQPDGARRPLRLLSVVAPMYDEVDAVEEFHRRVTEALDGVPIEIVISNDASTDGTGEALDALADRDPRVKVVHLSRNFGHQASLTAALEHASGDVVVMIDGDLQDPPELIPKMLDEWRAGVDVVYAVRAGAARRDAPEARHRALVLRASSHASRASSCARTRPTSGCSTGARSTRCWRCPSATASCAG